jgi:hypothetical protein
MVRLSSVTLPVFFWGPNPLGRGWRWSARGGLVLSLVGGLVAPIARATEDVLPAIAPPAATSAALATALPALAQGQSITVNGNPAPIPWMIINGQIGLADYGVTDVLGATLLSSGQPQRQPVQWFAETGGRTELPAWVQGGYRYLDIRALAERHGWRVQPQGGTLQITTAPVQVLAVQRQAIPGGERLVLNLSGPAPVALADGGDRLTLTLGASTDQRLIQEAIATPAGAFLGELTVVPVAAGVRFQASTTHPPRLTTQATPPQIAIDIRADHLQPHSIAWAPGLRWQQRYISVAGQPFPVYWLQINPAQANLRPIWTDPTTAVGTAPLITTAQRWQATAAINAGFFNRNNQFPLGAVRSNNNWISGPILSRGVVGWNSTGQARMDRLFLRQTLTAGPHTFPVQAINSGYVQAGIGLYTSAWGTTYHPIAEGETLVTVIDGVVTAQNPANSLAGLGLPIPTNGYVLALRSYATAAQALPPGQRVAIRSELLPNSLEPFPNLVGGGPLLIRDRTIVLNAQLEQFSTAFSTQAAPRSAIGLTPSGEMLWVAVHHSPRGPGPTLNQLAQIMLQLGSTDALNLDGGSSASLYLGGRLINRSPRTAARVHNGIGLFLP